MTKIDPDDNDFFCLAIDCSGRDVTYGIISKSETITSPVESSRSVQSLIPELKKSLQQASLDPQKLQLVAVTYGPGAFTSLRIGITAAKVLGYCFSAPVVGINTLDALAFSTARALKSGQHSSKRLTVSSSIDAFRNQVFFKTFSLNLDHPNDLVSPFFSDQWRSQLFSLTSESEKSTDNHFSPNLTEVDDPNPKSIGQQLLLSSLDHPSYSDQHISELEKLGGDLVWETHTKTVLEEQKEYLESKMETDGQSEKSTVFAASESWKNKLCRQVGSTADGGWFCPCTEQMCESVGILAALNQRFLLTEQKDAMALQPVYFRKSAAEENLTH